MGLRLRAITLIAFSQTLIASRAEAILIREGTYSDRGITVTVRARPFAIDGGVMTWMEIEARGTREGRAEFGRIYVNPQTFEASASPLQRGPGRVVMGHYLPSPNYVLVGAEAGGSGPTRARWERGGVVAGQHTVITLTADGQTGALLSFRWGQRVARWSLPNGWHSGPVKQVISEFACDQLLTT